VDFILYIIKKKKKKFHTVGTVPESNRKIVERCKIDTHNTQELHRRLSWLGTGTAIKRWLI
jgi:hypothetical protein